MPLVIVDYDVGNLHSVAKAFEKVGAAVTVSRDSATIASAGALVLPGVGAFSACMENLIKFDLRDAVTAFIASGRPFLGICVGYQILFESSEEFGRSEGLGAMEGECVRFDFGREPDAPQVPHMGWNQVNQIRPSPLFDGIGSGTDFYFVHSYYPVPASDDVVIATCDYGGVSFAAAIQKGRLFATQFHPEKSQRAGLALLENFARMATGD